MEQDPLREGEEELEREEADSPAEEGEEWAVEQEGEVASAFAPNVESPFLTSEGSPATR